MPPQKLEFQGSAWFNYMRHIWSIRSCSNIKFFRKVWAAVYWAELCAMCDDETLPQEVYNRTDESKDMHKLRPATNFCKRTIAPLELHYQIGRLCMSIMWYHVSWAQKSSIKVDQRDKIKAAWEHMCWIDNPTVELFLLDILLRCWNGHINCEPFAVQIKTSLPEAEPRRSRRPRKIWGSLESVYLSLSAARHESARLLRTVQVKLCRKVNHLTSAMPQHSLLA